MREVNVSDVTACIKRLCIEANYFLNSDIYDSFKDAYEMRSHL